MKQSVLILFMLASSLAFSQLKMYSFEEVDALQIKNPKPVFIFIHADWCKICHLMKNTTLKNPQVIAKLNTDFYTVLFDSENKEPIFFNQHTYVFKPTGTNTGLHELALELGTIDGELALPTTCILDENYDIVFQYQKSLTKKELLLVLTKITEL